MVASVLTYQEGEAVLDELLRPEPVAPGAEAEQLSAPGNKPDKPFAPASRNPGDL